jgi:hypothetical protein
MLFDWTGGAAMNKAASHYAAMLPVIPRASGLIPVRMNSPDKPITAAAE